MSADPQRRPSEAPEPPAARRHVVITGTGRAGTTFLMELLTHLGLDTGFDRSDLARHIDPFSLGGLEHDIRRPDAPYFYKSPWFIDHADEILQASDIAIDHVFIPVRNLAAAADSRRAAESAGRARMPFRKRLRLLGRPKGIPGGLWHTRSLRRGEQEIVLADQLSRLLVSLADTHVPVSLISFPRMVRDPEYLFTKLEPVLEGLPYDAFATTFSRIARPELVGGDDANWSEDQ